MALRSLPPQDLFCMISGLSVVGFRWAHIHSVMVKAEESGNKGEALDHQMGMVYLLFQTVSYFYIGPWIKQNISNLIPRFLLMCGIQYAFSLKNRVFLSHHLTYLAQNRLSLLQLKISGYTILFTHLLTALMLFRSNPIAGTVLISFQLLSFLSCQNLLPDFIKSLLYDKLLGAITITIDNFPPVKSLLMTNDLKTFYI